MKQFKFFFPCLLLLASCTQEAVLPDNGAVEIRLSAGIGSLDASNATRGVVNADYASPLEVYFVRVDQAANGSWPAYTTVAITPLAATRAGGAGQQGITFTTPQFYQTGETNNGTKLIGWYPLGVYNYMAEKVTIDISNGTTDVMSTPEVTGDKVNTFGTGGRTFTFNHLLTQVTVKAFASGDATASLWGKVTSVKVKEQPTNCVIPIPNSSSTTWSGQADLLLKNPADDTDMAATNLSGVAEASPVTLGYAMFKPTTTPSLTLEVTTEKGGARIVKATLPGGSTPNYFAAGTAYTVTLNFKSTLIQPTATISDWKTGPDVPADL